MVASVSVLSSAGQAASYYEADDYYAEGGMAPSEWFGEAAEKLGLSGEVDREQFAELLEGRIAGQQLGTTRLPELICDGAMVASALAGTEATAAVHDFPTVAQLRQVVLAEQERMAGNPAAAVARLRPLARQDTALVAAHWALMRAERDAGNADAAAARSRWLATRRGRVWTENTTTDVLRFFNVAVSAQALKADPERTSAVSGGVN